ncbi:MAG: polyprenyl synthetase family protein [Moraxella sp.]|nr:polyprenyl synthetase family protein [Moraxella sp.]
MLTATFHTPAVSAVRNYEALLGFLPTFETDVVTFFDVKALPQPLGEACRYAMAAGGKRLRPLLVFAAFFALSERVDRTGLDMARRAAMAVELLHGYSLVHDDLPCMDDDALRRGRPTCHIVYGEDVALLAGDALQSLAFESLSVPMTGLALECAMTAKLLGCFSVRARRMVTGQMLDILGEKITLAQSELERIHQDKTGALIEAAVLMGGICAGASDTQMVQLSTYACALGLAFQVQDDVLDVTADTATLGKPAGSDEKLDKSTYVKLLGVDGAYAYADKLFLEACEAAAALGEAGGLLVEIAKVVADRKK